MKYSPKPIPATMQREDAAYLSQELNRLRDVLNETEVFQFAELNAEPARLADGMLAYADGTNWNPGQGEGLYFRQAGAWETLVGLQADENETISGDWTFTGAVNLPDNYLELGTTSQRNDFAYVNRDSTNPVFQAAQVGSGDIARFGKTTTLGSTSYTGLFKVLNGGDIAVDTAGTGYAIRNYRGGTLTGGFYHDLTSQYWLNSAGQTVIQNAYGSKAVTFGGNVNVTGGDLVIASHDVLMNNLDALFWKDTGGTSRRFITCWSDNIFYVGEGNTIATQVRGSTVTISPGTTLNISSGGNINVTPTGQFQLLSGNSARVFESGNTYYSEYEEVTNSGFTAPSRTRIGRNGGGAITIQAVSLADDATATFNHGGYAICFLLDNYNGTAYAHFGIAGANAPVDYGSGSLLSFGASNPNVDGRVNVYTSPSGTLSIKNRLGSTRSFYVFLLDISGS